MATDRYVVTAPLIVVKVPGAQGGEAYVKRDRFLPASVSKAEITRLLDLGLVELDPAIAVAAAIAEAEEAAALAAVAEAERAANDDSVPDGDPTDEWTVKQIDAYAEAHNIDLTGHTKKPEKLAAIAAARQA